MIPKLLGCLNGILFLIQIILYECLWYMTYIDYIVYIYKDDFIYLMHIRTISSTINTN